MHHITTYTHTREHGRETQERWAKLTRLNMLRHIRRTRTAPSPPPQQQPPTKNMCLRASCEVRTRCAHARCSAATVRAQAELRLQHIAYAFPRIHSMIGEPPPSEWTNQSERVCVCVCAIGPPVVVGWLRCQTSGGPPNPQCVCVCKGVWYYFTYRAYCVVQGAGFYKLY